MSNNNSRRSSLMDLQQHHNHNYNHSSSFSSSLLEEIYRSFDEDKLDNRQNCSVMSYRKIMDKSTSCYLERENKYERQDNYNNRFVLDQWIDKSDNYNRNKVNFRRNSMAEVNSVQKLMNSSSSSSSSSESSSGIGGFSSSESESLYGSSKSKMNAKSLTLKPIRTSLNPPETYRKSYSDEVPAKKISHGCKEGNLQRRALKLYGDLKKVKQPISPGGKLASFLNSLFNSTSSKKPKISSPSTYVDKLTASTPSTASSYTRSCLSKTPSSTGRFERRSVRFCPVNTVISATDNHHNERNVVWKGSDNDNKELKVKIMEKNRRVEEVAKELLKNYHHGRKYSQNDVVNMMNKSIKSTKSTNDNSKIRRFEVEVEDEEEEDDDDISCCSSDLFELENLLDIGVDGRYGEELPVYETTHVDTNRAIANGFIL